MKSLALLILPAVLSACAPAAVEKKETLPAARPVVQTVKKNIKKTTAAYMTDQENELKQILNGSAFSITRHNNILTMTFSGNAIFAENSYHPTVQATEILKKIAPVLSAYTKTRISIIGHTDGMGKPSTNQLMSEKRAQAVADVLKKAAKIASVRLWIEGRGNEKTESSQPRGNGVEITLTPTFVQ